METKQKQEYIMVANVEGFEEVLNRNSIIPFDIYFKRKQSPRFKVYFLEGSFLNQKQKENIFNQPDYFYVLKTANLRFQSEVTFNWELLFREERYEEKKIVIKKFLEFCLDGHLHIGQLIRNFHYAFPIKKESYQGVGDDDVFSYEVSLFFRILVYVSVGLYDKGYLSSYVTFQRHNHFGDTNEIFNKFKLIQPCIYQHQLIGLRELIEKNLTYIAIYDQINSFLSEEKLDKDIA